MKTQITASNRKKLVRKMKTVFNEKIQALSPEFQGILLDDLVTAFESRLAVLEKEQTTFLCIIAATEDVKCETV
jgi:hypothetical protein